MTIATISKIATDLTARARDPRVAPLIRDRWSPRAFDGTDLPQADLDTILEAAVLAPSAYNYQPWRFLYAHRAKPEFARFLEPLVPFNQSWAKDAGVLLYAISQENSAGPQGVTPNHSHSFDTGSAWAMLALQATALGYQTHGMTGVDFDLARDVLSVPEGYRIEAAIAIGRQAPAEHLPETLREREVPSTRRPIDEVAREGVFADSLR